MTTLTLKTTPANRKELAESFGQNQSAVRRLEAMIQDITVTLPDAIDQNSSDLSLAQLVVQTPLPVQNASSLMLAQLAVSSMAQLPARNESIRARMEAAAYVSPPPSVIKQSSGVFQAAQQTGTSLTSGTAANAVSLPLPAGTWDISGVIVFNSASSTVLERITAGVATASATLGTPDTYQQLPEALVGADPFNLLAPTTRITLASAANVFLVAQAIFTTSTLTADGYIQARPV